MKTKVHLVVNSKGKVRMYVNRPSPSSVGNDVPIELHLEVPDSMFKKPTISTSVTLEDPKEAKAFKQEVVNNVRKEMARQTGIDVNIEIVST